MNAITGFTRRFSSLLLAVGLTFGQFALAQDKQAEERIGSVDFPVSCNDSAKEDFNHALGLMHHMMYEQARARFKKISEVAPGCAMAYWGVATTLFQPLWDTRPSEQDLQMGRRHIERARNLKPATGPERLLLDATAGFFEKGKLDLQRRYRSWIEGMEIAYQAHPDNHDIAALYALSRLTLAKTAEDRDPLHDEAESILRAIWEQEPRHPGAIHYSIHATDVNNRAANALDMVKAYRDIAPQVPHAMHMPSHIYVRLGQWPEVIEWNRRSADAAKTDLVNGAVSHHYVHALDYLLYAYLQQGRDAEARAVLEEATAVDKHQATFISTYHLAAMPARLAVERRTWAEAAALEPRTPDYLPWDQSRWAEALTWYAKGLGAVHTDKRNMAREAEQRMASLQTQAETEGDSNFATYIEIDRNILTGWIAHAEGQPEAAVQSVRAAVELDQTVEKHPVTPGALMLPNEALGALLLELDRPSEALKAFQAADAAWPGRYNTLLGAAHAAEQAGEPALARQFSTRLQEMTGDSDRTSQTEEQ
ncbi:MAG: hypothetical protein KGY54_07930 [Oleiphilaceae bacterium]|nr:hypothetical protein [Oleiphilaceae bacterium]